MTQITLISLAFCFLAGCAKKINITNPEAIEGLIYKNTFESEKQTIDGGSYFVKKEIHNYSLSFNTNDSTFTRYKINNTNNNNFFTISLWLKPEFFGRNGTIITLSKNQKDFPIKSSLSLFMNKNRIAVMQEGKDLRKIHYKNQNNFTTYFMSLKELYVGETYFLTYLYNNGGVKIFVDGLPYAEYHNVPSLTDINYISLGASWNKKGGKFYFNGYIDDLYIYNRNLNQDEINDIMDFTHVYQYAK